MKVIKVLVAGGCHIVGFGVGADNSFTELLNTKFKEIGVPCEMRKLAYSNLSKTEDLHNAIEEFKPDIVILQHGNYESPKILRALKDRTSIELDKSFLNDFLMDPEISKTASPYKPMIRHRIKFLIKLLVIHIFPFRAHHRRNVTSLAQNLKILLDDYKNINFIIMTSFPTHDYARDLIRRDTNSIMESTFQGSHYIIADTYSLLNTYKASAFINCSHLNTRGHQLISEFLFPVIQIISGI